MFRTLMIWYILNPLNQPVTSPEAFSKCIVVNRTAQPGEQQIAGPFASEQAGIGALHRYAACILKDCNVGACYEAGN